MALFRYFGPRCDWTRFYTADSVDKEILFKGDLNFFQNIPFNCNQLKRLKVYGFNSEILKVINKLIYLEHLELFNMHPDEMEMTLNLPILKILYIYYIISNRISKPIIIDAPMLKCFSFFGNISTYFKFLKPGSITYLEVSCDKISNLNEYASVEIFKMSWPSYIIDQNIIQQLPNLREFHLQQNVNCRFDYETVRIAMNHILEQKVVHGKHDLKVYFLQHLLEPVDKKFEDYDFRSKYNNHFCDFSGH